MLRKIIKIDQEKCSGCGACADACHEGAIDMVDGKAVLTRESYCDGLGDCLPACPAGAITFEEREAPAYDEAAVLRTKAEKNKGCPGARPQTLRSQPTEEAAVSNASRLSQWPVQIKLAPVRAPYFNGANLLIAADCAAYAFGDFHNTFIKDRVTLIGCPKLDEVDYAEKLTEIIAGNQIKSVTIVRMGVPCCGGLENAVKRALQSSGKPISWQVAVISTDGRILER
ncbi:MAG: 4Fe-4S binding protein [Oscillibacter sp.]|nr:4Fe-4S binding protein [Oscillibacter sp.]